MELTQLLAEYKSVIVKKWFTAVTESYPENTARFLKTEKDPFANPVGRSLAEELDELFDLITTGDDGDRLKASLDRIIRVRAVQEFSPAQALSFVLDFKGICRQAVSGSDEAADLADQMAAFEDLVDRVLLLAVDVYVGCREDLYRISANEFRNQSFRLLERFNLIGDQVFRPGKGDNRDGNEA